MSPTSYQTAPPRAIYALLISHYLKFVNFFVICTLGYQNFMSKNTENLFKKLVEICARLRRKDGCMWDIQQDHSSLVPYLVEETQEVKDAIKKKDMTNLCEELGDLLYQVLFHCRIAEENGEFSIDDVIKGINDKIIRRHPHVFSNQEVSSVEDIVKNWEKIKKEEKENKNP